VSSRKHHSAPKPPRILLRFFKWFCHPKLHTYIEGDLLELYRERVEEKGKVKADLRFALDVLLLFRPGVIRPFEGYYRLNFYDMFNNYLKTGFRNLVKRKEYSVINILGLAIGIASSLIIALFIQNEFSYDKFFSEADQIYKIVEERKYPEHTELNVLVPYSFADIVVQDYPEVSNATFISGPYSSQSVSVKDKNDELVSFLENNVFLADSNFLNVFNFKMLAGNPKTALLKPNSVVLTESAAKRYFGDENPLGKMIFPSGKNSIVTGVCEDPPKNSHFQFNYLVSSTSVGWLNQSKFNLKSAHCYIKLKDNVDYKKLEAKFPALVAKYVVGEIERVNKVSWKVYENAGNGFTYFLKPLTSIHLDPANLGRMKPSGNINTIYILGAIAIFIFTIACINFINLSIARANERSKEVGLRKVMGSNRAHLIAQFFTESFILSFISVLLAVGIVFFTLPYFNIFIGGKLVLNTSFNMLLIFLAIIFLVGLFAGLYPSFVLSAFKPITSLKGNITTPSKGKWIRSGLVIFQFCVSIIIIICTLVIQQQIKYFGEKDLGFDKAQIIVLEGAFDKNVNNTLPFLNALKEFPQVEAAAGTLWVQGFQGVWTDRYRIQGASEVFSTPRVIIGDTFAEVLGFKLLEGRFFSENENDSSYVILNESAVKYMGIKNPIGEEIALITENKGKLTEVKFTIKGVIKDFHYQTLHDEISPLVIQSNENNFGRIKYITAKLKPGSTAQTLSNIENTWKTMMPGKPFNFRFLDETLNAKYQNEKQIGVVFSIFSSLSIFIACIGLFALSSYMVLKRTKEIGIRKVLGASITHIVLLFSLEYIKMMLWAFILAVPIAYYFMNEWLQQFAYHIEIQGWVFIVPAIFLGILISSTISSQSIKAALSNPIDSLRSE